MIEVKETIGICRVCGHEDILGDGLCQRCWDRNGQPLTKRETEVLLLTAQGASNDTISNIMFITKNTVEHHFHSIFNKINIPDWADKRSWLAVNSVKFIGDGNGHRC